MFGCGLIACKCLGVALTSMFALARAPSSAQLQEQLVASGKSLQIHYLLKSERKREFEIVSDEVKKKERKEDGRKNGNFLH